MTSGCTIGAGCELRSKLSQARIPSSGALAHQRVVIRTTVFSCRRPVPSSPSVPNLPSVPFLPDVLKPAERQTRARPPDDRRGYINSTTIRIRIPIPSLSHLRLRLLPRQSYGHRRNADLH